MLEFSLGQCIAGADASPHSHLQEAFKGTVDRLNEIVWLCYIIIIHGSTDAIDIVSFKHLNI